MEIGIFIAAGAVFFLVLTVFFVRRLEKVRSAEVLSKFEGQELLGCTSNANFFGIESAGLGQVRGNGVLLLTKEELYFEMWIPRKEIRIPVQSIVEVKSVRSHLMKSKGIPLLKVVFTNPKGLRDSCAWAVANLEIWLVALQKLSDLTSSDSQ